MKKIIITLDGYSSCGKSTLAKQLAAELDYVYIDSGAMYRAITLYFIQNRIDWNNPEEVAQALSNIQLEFIYNPLSGSSEMNLNGENVEHMIREMLVAEKVSEVAAVGAVREFAVAQQQEMGRQKGIVMDGRDIGTTVFPHAELKIFMTADTAIRVERRFKELYAKNKNITIHEIRENLELRDYIDTNREISPLRKAEDAIILDNSQLTPEDQLKLVLQWVDDAVMVKS
ncbi:(d)CMP kinase [Chitinophaga sancti]|uniref:Cytidylate kinase n=1 Tax=Chitinophaga sancti TaxID=1004 RepID=A0A1K1QI78_9BACT|nr:(d)CMP kinase [Chitinophaga sancti]WQD65268.1 (d)CMP kinase [Chitinophaga sancti]WQG89108.1 (d)CMP kinase [Chitinophaga sancti]SFW59369.1 cytidylate kinase [Chitinophaga sancti]